LQTTRRRLVDVGLRIAHVDLERAPGSGGVDLVDRDLDADKHSGARKVDQNPVSPSPRRSGSVCRSASDGFDTVTADPAFRYLPAGKQENCGG